MPFPTVRPLIVGTGTATVSAGSRTVTFTNDQSFKTGASLVVGTNLFTIDQGSGKVWNTRQPGVTPQTNTFYKSNESVSSTARARGGAITYIIPDAPHFIYVSEVDETGAPDVKYTYADTLAPENGKHPYLRDLVSNSGMAAKTVSAIIPDMGTRVKTLEGVLRIASSSAHGTLVNPEQGLRELKARLHVIEKYLNSAGPLPAVGASGAQNTIESIRSFGDAV